jgi:tRNA (cmo5U34)-methyltransferase
VDGEGAGDGIRAGLGAWTFRDPEVVSAFDRHVAASVPEYDAVQRLVAGLSTYFATPGSVVVDLGCATGRTLREIARACPGRDLSLVGVDDSAEMVSRARELAAAEGVRVEFVAGDVRRYRLPAGTSLVVAVYALQFLAPADRADLVARLAEELRPGAGLVIVEKIVSEIASFAVPFDHLHIDLKLAAGHSPQEVLAKAASLRGVLRPLSAGRVEAELRGVGFVVERFWQNLCFCGWLAERQ